MTLIAAAALLAHCSVVPLEDATEPAMPANYGAIIAKSLRTYPAFVGYTNFEISGLRWVHAETGWNWLACMRYDDRGRRRTYVFLINNNILVNARYDILTDLCDRQQYVPFDTYNGTIGVSTMPLQQQPIY